MNFFDRFKAVKVFVFDVDGVLTNGMVQLLDNGLQARQMNVKDGLALQMAMKNGYNVVVLSGASSEPVKERFRYLGITEAFLGISDKRSFFTDYLETRGLQWQEVLFMGDDLPDIPLLQTAGLAACPADAVQEVKDACHYISPLAGGMGCVRDVIEKVLKLNNHWKFNTEITSR